MRSRNCSGQDWMKVDQGGGWHIFAVRGGQVNRAKTKGEFRETLRTYTWVCHGILKE